ncbi:MAG: rhomboid family intramembrane serine protease [Anaerolineaceae bacterium]|nr:rhomboid family intramembrane serine protease [Anaerolineaceae bacterium]
MTEQPPNPTTETPRERVRIKMPQAKPVATIILIGFTVIVFALQFPRTPGSSNDILFLLGGKINVLIAQGQVWRFITPVFLHGSVPHLAFNMYALYVIGRNLERFYGHGRFLLLYFLGAFGGNVLSYVLSPVNSLGASTALFAILAAEGVFIVGNRKLFGPQRTRQMITNLVMVTLINLSFGLIPGFNVDSWGHIGGILAGIFFAWKAGPILQIKGQPPFFEMVDSRKKGEVLLTTVIVLVGFTIIAFLPTFTG